VTSTAVRIQPLRGRAIFAVLTLGLCALHGLAAAVLPLIRPGVEPRLRWHPIWAYGSWLIPLASLVIPLLVVREIDRASRHLANGSDRGGLFAVWATSWTIFQLAWFVPGGDVVKVVVAVVETVAAVAAMLLVLRITAEQKIAGSPT
jgi:hypothetical protein